MATTKKAVATGKSNGKAKAAPVTAGNGATASTATSGVPATAADASEAAGLPKATQTRGNPPSIDQAQALASSTVQAALTSNAAVLEALGVDGASLATAAAATAEAGERTLRLFESAFRSAEDYHAQAKAIAPQVTALSKALGKLDAKPLRKAFSAFLQERNVARGVSTAKRTKQKNKRTKANAGAAAPAANGAAVQKS